jgi:hypothetical protein
MFVYSAAASPLEILPRVVRVCRHASLFYFFSEFNQQLTVAVNVAMYFIWSILITLMAVFHNELEVPFFSPFINSLSLSLSFLSHTLYSTCAPIFLSDAS